jgi:hypothetical protein
VSLKGFWFLKNGFFNSKTGSVERGRRMPLGATDVNGVVEFEGEASN